MLVGCYCFKDELVGFDKPQLEANDNVALRSFAYAIKNNEFLKKNANNYSLWKLADFDNEKGTWKIEKSYPLLLANGSSFIEVSTDDIK